MRKLTLFVIMIVLFCSSAFSGTEAIRAAFCVLVVSGKRFMSEPCKVSDYTYANGQTHDVFYKGKKYFGYINQNDDGSFEGFWNAPDAETHAQAPLGMLGHKGQCWANKEARICIYYDRHT